MISAGLINKMRVNVESKVPDPTLRLAESGTLITVQKPYHDPDIQMVAQESEDVAHVFEVKHVTEPFKAFVYIHSRFKLYFSKKIRVLLVLSYNFI